MPAPCDLSRTQLDILSVLAESSRTGADVAAELNDQYADPPHHSTVYYHLSELSDDDLITQQSDHCSSRSVAYQLTRDGRALIREYATGLAVRIQTGELRDR